MTEPNTQVAKEEMAACSPDEVNEVVKALIDEVAKGLSFGAAGPVT